MKYGKQRTAGHRSRGRRTVVNAGGAGRKIEPKRNHRKSRRKKRKDRTHIMETLEAIPPGPPIEHVAALTYIGAFP